MLLFILASCSNPFNSDKKSADKSPNISDTAPSVGLSTANYVSASENIDAIYKSTNIQITQIEGNLLIFTIGQLNDYAKDKTGAPRAGNHPAPEFRMQSASYTMIKEGSRFKLEFIGSSCLNDQTNPFSDLVPQYVDISQTDNSISLTLSDQTHNVAKDEDSFVSDLFSNSNIQRTLCQGEDNE